MYLETAITIAASILVGVIISLLVFLHWTASNPNDEIRLKCVSNGKILFDKSFKPNEVEIDVAPVTYDSVAVSWCVKKIGTKCVDGGFAMANFCEKWSTEPQLRKSLDSRP